MARDRSRIVGLTKRFSESQAKRESASTKFVASVIPGDIVDLSERLSGMLSGAGADHTISVRRRSTSPSAVAENEAGAILADAEVQWREVAELRAELETQRQQLRAQVAYLRRQAVMSAAEIMTEAESHASAILTEMNAAVTSHVADTQGRLAELIDARAKIVGQIERSTGQVNRAKQVNADTPANTSRRADRESALAARETWFRENRPH
ncbi:hypothetical protein A5735_14980 [Mycolicibacter heraklionensis]|nr:hypothetical protein A5735_14980 [Mycolicibacter heraklionensis]